MPGTKNANRAQSLAGASGEVYDPRPSGAEALRENSVPAGDPERLVCSGRASSTTVVALVAAALALFLALRLFGVGGATDGAGPAPMPQSQPQPTDPGPASPPAGDSRPGPAGTSPGAAPRTSHEQPRRQPAFEGRGSLRGMVTVVGGGPLPEVYTVHVGPSNSLQGRERAASASVEVQGPDFAFPDLPLGGYDVWVDAEGLNSLRTPVQLQQASPDPYVVVRVSPTGFLDGHAFTHDGRPAEGLRVALETRRGEVRLETATRSDGSYRFDSVPDGEYRILFGPLHAPLVPERELAFQAPSMRFPKVELPPTGEVLFHTTDLEGKALGEVTLTGFGRPAGRLELVTDPEGRAWGRHLLPGRYKLSARHADGRRARATLEVQVGPGQEEWIALR